MAFATRRRQAVGSACAANARECRLAGGRRQPVEEESGARAGRPVPGSHGVGQAAGPPDDGDAAVAERDPAEPARS